VAISSSLSAGRERRLEAGAALPPGRETVTGNGPVGRAGPDGPARGERAPAGSNVPVPPEGTYPH
jgi:hypothetical protein